MTERSHRLGARTSSLTSAPRKVSYLFMDANPKAYPPQFATPEALAEFQRKEAEAARKGAHDMWVAGVTIVASFVFVLVLVVLVIIIGHIPLF